MDRLFIHIRITAWLSHDLCKNTADHRDYQGHRDFGPVNRRYAQKIPVLIDLIDSYSWVLLNTSLIGGEPSGFQVC